MADCFNDYFVNIGQNLAQKIPPSTRSFFEFLDNRNSASLFFNPVLEVEVLELVNNLKSKKSAGHDGISSICLKQIIFEIVKPLTHIINLSISSGVVPQKMKLAKVIPLFKKGDPLNVTNYRPISLLTSISKILEKIVYSRTMNFLQEKSVLCESQFGFREKHSIRRTLF